MSLYKHRFLGFPCIATALLLCFPLRTKADDFPAGADPHIVTAAAEEVNAERYPDADIVYLFSRTRDRYEPDGTSVSHGEYWIKILTEKGRREQGTVSFRFNEAYGTVEIPLAERHTDDETVIPIDVPALSRVMIDPSQMHSNIYNPLQKVLRLGIPGLEIGDMVRIRYIRRQTKTRMPDTWSDYSVLESTAPMLHAVHEILAPPERPLVHRMLKGEVPDTVRYEKDPSECGGVLHRWTARDVPRLFEEPAMPDWWTVSQRLLVSTIPDWETVSRWYWNLSLPRLESVTPAMEDKVRELTEGRTDRQDRIEALFRFVSQQVRYMGLTTEEEAPGYEPRDVHETFDLRYGVCRDKAALLVALLRLDGFEAFPVLIHVGPRKDDEVPQPFFNHAIVAVREPDGSYQLMDMTDETTRDLLPAYLGNRSYLVATPEGETLKTSPVPPAEENLATIETDAVLTDTGALEGTTRIRLEGINDNLYRGYFASVKPAERRRFFEGLLKRVVPGAELRDFELNPDDMQDASQPITVVLGFAAPDYPVRDHDTLLIPPPWFGGSVGMVNFVLRQTGLHERRFPLLTEYACGVEEQFTLRLPETLDREHLTLPEPVTLDDPALFWSQDLDLREPYLEGRFIFHLHTPEFSPNEYLELREWLGDLEYHRREWPMAGESTDADVDTEADVSYAFRRVHLEWNPDGSWTETRSLRKTVLTLAGIKDHAEHKTPFNPAWDDVELVEANVTAPDGTVRHAREEEINLMDAPWAAGAPRYPGEQTLVVNLPDVRIGSVIDVTTRRTRAGRPFFGFRKSFGGLEPAERIEVLFDAPPEADFVSRILPNAGRIQVEETTAPDGRIRRTWTLDQPDRSQREDYLPPAWILHPTLFLSSGDWPGYAAELGEYLEQATADSEEASRVARELGERHDTPREQVRAVRDYVARRIRNAGPDFIRLPPDTLTSADRTLADGYGHSADRAIVLVAMLEALNLNPSFVAVSSWPADSTVAAPLSDIPQRSLFPAVLVRVEAEGETWYLNDTDQYAELGATPNDGSLSLEIPGGGLGVVRAASGQARATWTGYDIRLGREGEALIERTRRFEGTAHAAARRRFEEMTPEDLRRYHQEAVSSLSIRAVPEGELSLDFTRYPGEERFTVSIDRFAVREGRNLFYHLPEVPAMRPLRADRRTHPIWWDEGITETVRHRIEAPPGFRTAEPPLSRHWSAPNEVAVLRREIRPGPAEAGDGMVWEWETRIERRPGLIQAEYYPELLEAQRRISHPRNRVLRFEE